MRARAVTMARIQVLPTGWEASQTNRPGPVALTCPPPRIRSRGSTSRSANRRTPVPYRRPDTSETWELRQTQMLSHHLPDVRVSSTSGSKVSPAASDPPVEAPFDQGAFTNALCSRFETLMPAQLDEAVVTGLPPQYLTERRHRARLCGSRKIDASGIAVQPYPLAVELRLVEPSRRHEQGRLTGCASRISSIQRTGVKRSPSTCQPRVASSISAMATSWESPLRMRQAGASGG